MDQNNLLPIVNKNELSKITHHSQIDLFKEPCQMLCVNNTISDSSAPELINKKSSMYFYKITELAYEKDFPQREAFENVISSVHNTDHNFVYLLSGDREKVSIYLGIVDNNRSTDKNTSMNCFDVSQAMINSLCGNFMGTKQRALSKDEVQNEIISVIRKSKRKSFMYGIPSMNEDKPGETNVFQGVDRLINSMNGETYQFLLVCEPVDKMTIDKTIEEVYQYYNQITSESEKDFSANQTSGDNYSKTEGTSDTSGKNISVSTNEGNSSSENYSHSSTSKNSGSGTSKGTSQSHTKNNGETWGTNKSEGKTINFKIVEKKLKEEIQYIDEEYLPRLKLGRAKGLFKTAIYAMSTDNATLVKLEGNIRSIFQGDKSTFAPLNVIKLFDPKSAQENDIAKQNTELVTHFQIYNTTLFSNEEAYLLRGIEINGNYSELATYLTAREISLLGGLPQSEVTGIKLNEAVDFGVNVPETKEGFELGHIVHRGNELTNSRVNIDHNILSKHIFISGVTGSGKTTTCQKILLEAKLPFLVIEPAKTEYRQLYEKNRSIRFYTVGKNDLCPFRINPMELVRGESLSSHIDMLMATFQAVYPMEASIPYILKEAIINCYEKLGWDLESNENRYSDDPWAADGLFWPIFSNVVSELRVVVNSKGFAADLKNNYIGSLISRFNDLTIGTRGSIFNVPLSVNFKNIIEQNVVIELDELKSEEDKVLLMGLVLSRMSEVLKKKHRADRNFRHVTLIEEAHRLLTKPEPGESSKKLAVQTFTDMLAEVRKYGEGLVIVDQIPGKLTPEVMKNTNTKIVHKIFAEDDKTAVAHCISLDDKQKQHLSKLNVGEAVVYTEGWHKPVIVKVKARSNTTHSPIVEEDISRQGKIVMNDEKALFFPAFSGYILTDGQLDFLARRKNSLVKKLLPLIRTDLNDENTNEIKEIFKQFRSCFALDEKLFASVSRDIWTYLKCFYYDNNLAEFTGSAERWLADYFKNVIAGTLNYGDVTPEFKFIDKIKEKINIK